MVVENETIVIAFGVFLLLLGLILFHLIVMNGKMNEVVTKVRRLDAVQCDLSCNLNEYEISVKNLNDTTGKLLNILLNVNERFGIANDIQKKLIKILNKLMYKK